MRRLLTVLASAFAIVFGLMTLLGLLAGDGLGFLTTFTTYANLGNFSSLFLQLAAMTAGVTIFIGILNLVGVHLGRIAGTRQGWPYSLVMLLSALLVVGLTLAERLNLVAAPEGQRAPTAVLLESVQVSVESALAALVLFSLVYGAYRLMRRQVTWPHLIFTLVLLVVLLGALPLPGTGIRLLNQISEWLMAVPVSAGARGILLGIALATLVTGLRVLIGQDRSYRD